MNSAIGANIERQAFFLDRDGVVNVDHGYISCRENFEFMPGIFPALRCLSEAGYVLVIVTNQSGIGRGYYSEKEYLKLTDWMVQQFKDEHIELGAVYFCPHSPEEDCSCRKPSPEMFFRAQRELNLDLSASWMVGDKESDMQAAKAAGIPNRVFFGIKQAPSCTRMISSLEELPGCVAEGNG